MAVSVRGARCWSKQWDQCVLHNLVQAHPVLPSTVTHSIFLLSLMIKWEKGSSRPVGSPSTHFAHSLSVNRNQQWNVVGWWCPNEDEYSAAWERFLEWLTACACCPSQTGSTVREEKKPSLRENFTATQCLHFELNVVKRMTVCLHNTV